MKDLSILNQPAGVVATPSKMKVVTDLVDLSQLKPDSVLDVLRSVVTDNSLDNEDSFYVSDVGDVYRQYKRWEACFPTVVPFFAIKCNPDPYFLQLLVKLGAGFDCASKNEIQTVLNYGVDPSRIIYANPCKPMSHIKFAASKGVRKMTFDNSSELKKIQLCHPNAQVVLRILTDDSKSVCQFGIKFGASLANTEALLNEAKALNLDVIGVSFHVGSGCMDADSYRDAIRRARVVFDQAKELGFNMRLLDIGGGFPGANNTDGSISVEEIAETVYKSINHYFPNQDLEVIAEPGRYFVTSALTLACNVTSRRVVPRDTSGEGPVGKVDTGLNSMDEHPSYMYYINDGVYGSFNCIMFDHAVISPMVLTKNGQFVAGADLSPSQQLTFESSVWGPTCDSLDVITRNYPLPELDVGDWMYFPDMGAYTTCAASEFNGYNKSRMIYVNTEADEVNGRLGL